MSVERFGIQIIDYAEATGESLHVEEGTTHQNEDL